MPGKVFVSYSQQDEEWKLRVIMNRPGFRGGSPL